ncbi:MAG TPA: CBS domain-containing protein [Kofleriaceae bacterium]|nr:CBS domain-containing protein [Kofleriaceae bacterium]
MAIFVTGRVLDTIGDSQMTSDDFDGVREARGAVHGAPPTGPGSSRSLLHATYIGCRATNSIARADRCLSCKRFVNFVPSADRREVTIRCAWAGDDPVTELMVPAARLLAIPARAHAGEARRVARDYEQELLLVVDGCALVGTVRRGILEWAAADREVSSLTQRRLWIATPHTTLADCARMFLDQPIDAIVIAEDSGLRGLLTRTDLREVGCL